MPLPAIVTMFMALEWVPYSYLLQCVLHMIPMYFKCKSGMPSSLSEIFNGFVPVSILVGRKDGSNGKLGSAMKESLTKLLWTGARVDQPGRVEHPQSHNDGCTPSDPLANGSVSGNRYPSGFLSRSAITPGERGASEKNSYFMCKAQIHSVHKHISLGSD